MDNRDYWSQFNMESLEDDGDQQQEDSGKEEQSTDKKEVAGTESFSYSSVSTPEKYSTIGFFEADIKNAQERREQMCEGQLKSKPIPLIARTCDKKNYRIYVTAAMAFNSEYLNKILCFLDSRTAGQTVTFILGTRMDDTTAHNLGSLLSAIQNCKAQVYGVCAGYCSITETMIWCFCKHQIMYRYGALSFGITEIATAVPVYKHYFQLFLQKAQDLKVLTEEERIKLEETGAEKMVLYSEYFQRTGKEPTHQE